MSESPLITSARAASQEATRIYVVKLHTLLNTIWWRPQPQVFLSLPNADRVQFFELWSPLSPTELLSTIVPVIYNNEDEIKVEDVKKAIAMAQDRLIVTWNNLIDVFRWSPKESQDTPVIWHFPDLVELALLFADAMIEYHQYIYASMHDDMDSAAKNGFFDLLMQLNGWIGAFKRTWRGAGWTNQTFEEVKPRVRRDVQAQLDRVQKL